MDEVKVPKLTDSERNLLEHCAAFGVCENGFADGDEVAFKSLVASSFIQVSPRMCAVGCGRLYVATDAGQTALAGQPALRGEP